MECVLTTLSLTRSASGGGAWLLRPAEQARATSILQRALKAEQSGANFHLTEEHPDGRELFHKKPLTLNKNSVYAPFL